MSQELAAQLLKQGQALRIKAGGSSMLPFLRHGDVMIVAWSRPREIGVGDVICYQASGRLFMHRVIERRHDGFVVKGDALAFSEIVEPAQLLGRVVAMERRGRVTQLDTPIARWRNRAIAALSPALSRLIPFGVGVARFVRTARRG